MDTLTSIRWQVFRLGARNIDIAEALGTTRSSISLKLAGKRPWRLEEVKLLCAMLKHRDPTLTYEALIGEPPYVAPPAPPETSVAA